MQTYTVSEFSQLIKNILQKNAEKTYKVCGEISNIKYSSGNVFFTLKDNESNINCKIWSNKSKEKLENGQQLMVVGYVSYYKSTINIHVNSFNILNGVGDLYTQYQDLFTHFTDLGYFASTIKKKLKTNVKTVGILTAAEGAALQDILYVLKNNNFDGKIIVKNCFVQGKHCVQSVIKGLSVLDDLRLDVVVVTRGGGSYEDLFDFSDERIVEALYKAKTCIVSAIGHEVDFMLSDYVADVRAPTPSIAAELICNNDNAIILDKNIYKIKSLIDRKINMIKNDLKKVAGTDIVNINGMKIANNIDKLKMMIDVKLIKIMCMLPKVKPPTLIMNYENKILNTREEFMKGIEKKKIIKMMFPDGVVEFCVRSIVMDKK